MKRSTVIAFILLLLAGTSMLAQQADSILVIVRYDSQIDLPTITKRVQPFGRIIATSEFFSRFDMLAPAFNIGRIQGTEGVRAVEQPPIFVEHNETSRMLAKVDRVQAQPWALFQNVFGLSGAGVRVGMHDGGVPHAGNTDFSGRLHVMEPAVPCNGSLQHPTHVAGTVAGSGGNSSIVPPSYPYRWCGMAPAADIYAWSFNNSANSCTNMAPWPSDEMLSGRQNQNIVLWQNSWGLCVGPPYCPSSAQCGLFGFYDSWCAEYDMLVRQEGLSIFFSAGNWRGTSSATLCGRSAGYGTISPFGTAKNIVSVGAVDENEIPASFSSFGPTLDHRLKPDIVAYGTNVMSAAAVPLNGYVQMSGTSMACPAVSGAAALLVERYRQIHGSDPAPSLLKAILLNSAKDIGTPGPDYATGFGLLNALDAVLAIDRQSHASGTVTQGQFAEHILQVQGACSLKVTLAYTDLPGPTLASATFKLVNDLDLTLIAPDNSVHLPLVLNPSAPASPAVSGVDNRNNVEQVVVALPGPGNWKIRVTGTIVTGGPQEYSLAWRGHDESAADLYSCDNDQPLDLGIEPNPDAGPMWVSKDIWVRRQDDGMLPVNHHQHEDPLYRDPTLLQPNYAYVKVRNRGCQPGSGLVRLYWAKAATGLSWPDSWDVTASGGTGGEIPCISSCMVTVASGGETVVKFEWYPPNPADYANQGIEKGHFCLVARIETVPAAPYGMHVPEGTGISANARNNNNVVWKNVTVVEDILGPLSTSREYVILRNIQPLPALLTLRFDVPGNEQYSSFFKIGDVTIDLGTDLYQKWVRAGSRGDNIEPAGGTRIRALGIGATIRDLPFDLREYHQVELEFTALRRPDTVPCTKSIDLVQLSPQPGTKSLQVDGGETFTVQITRWDTSITEVRRERIIGTGGFRPAVPNPTLGHSAVRFVLERAATLRLSLHDMQGREIRVIAEGHYGKGEHSLDVDLGDLPQGLYFYRLDLPGGSVTQSILRTR